MSDPQELFAIAKTAAFQNIQAPPAKGIAVFLAASEAYLIDCGFCMGFAAAKEMLREGADISRVEVEKP